MKKHNFILISCCVFFLFGSILSETQTWSTCTRLSWTSGISANPVAAVDSSGSLHVVWQEDKSGKYVIIHKKSTDGGMTWSNPTRLSWGIQSSEQPELAADSSGCVVVVWQNEVFPGNFDLFSKKSTDGGTTWSPINRVTWNNDSDRSNICFDSEDTLHLGYVSYDSPAGGFDYEIMYKNSLDKGTTWSQRKKITYNLDDSYLPYICSYPGGFLHISWNDESPGNWENFYKRSTDGGATWSAPVRLTWNPGYSFYSKLGIDTNHNIYAFWSDEIAGTSEIFYKKSTDGGVSWGNLNRLTWNLGGADTNRIAVGSDDTVHVVWRDNGIKYRYSTDGGMTWSPRGSLSSPGSPSSLYMIIDSNNTLHLTWKDNSSGNYEIYYQKRE